jgi:long-subunit fatty acid transport protein
VGIGAGRGLVARFPRTLPRSLPDIESAQVTAVLSARNVFDRTSVTAQNEVTGASVVIHQGYRNAWRFAAGLQWKVDERWQLRTGAAYDQTPIPASAVQAALPDADRVYLSGGVSYEFGSG